MATDEIGERGTLARGSAPDILLDGLFTGMIGALIVAIWFLVLDTVAGRPLWTPALLGSVLLHGKAGSALTTIQPVEVAAFTAVHFLVFVAVGVVLSYLMSLFERFPIMFFVLLVLFVWLEVGFIGLDTLLRTELIHKLHPWSVMIANLLAAAGMAAYLWKRHPSVARSIDQLWGDDPASGR